MPDPQTTNKQLYTPAHNADIDTWDVPVNANWNGLDQALGTYTTLNATGLSGTVALTTSQTIPLGFIVTGTPSGNLTYTTPAGVGGLWLVRNQATLGASITLGFASASGGSTVNIPSGKNIPVSADGTANGMVDIDTVAPTPGGSNTQVQVNIAGVLGGYAGFTFDGATLAVPSIHAATNVGIGTAPAAAPLTVDGLVNITSSGLKWPNGLTQTTSQVLQTVTTAITAASNVTGTYATTTGAAPTTAGGAAITGLATSFTPMITGSLLEIEVIIKGIALTGTDDFLLCLFRGSTLVDFAPTFVFNGVGQMSTLTLKTWLTSPGTSALAFTVRIGSNSGNTFSVNSTNNGAALAQSGISSWISIKELLAG